MTRRNPALALLLILGASAWVAPTPAAGQGTDVLTYHNDNARTGLNPGETVLTPANVNPLSFGKLFARTVDGNVYAQPLLLSGVEVPGRGTHNVVYVATQHDSVYAFDADSDAAPLWRASFIDPAAGVTTIPANMPRQGLNDLSGVVLNPCIDIIPEVGITGTPVIDKGSGTLYVVAKTKEVIAGHQHYRQRLHALDVATGSEKFGGPALIAETICDQTLNGPYQYVSGPTVPGAGESNDGRGNVLFNALRQHQRAGLALVDGVVYVAWAGHCDNIPYHGWMEGFDARTLRPVAVFNTTPNAVSAGNDHLAAGGIWQAGAAPAADRSAIYFGTGNGVFDPTFTAGGFPGRGDFGDSVIKVVADPGSTPSRPNVNGWGLKAADFFTPFDQALFAERDTDQGSGGVLILPDQPGPHPHLLVQAGKSGTVYLLDRDNLGKFHAGDDGQVVQSLPGAINPAWSMAAYFNETVYYNSSRDVLKAFRLTHGLLSTTPVARATTAPFGFPGATPSISAGPAPTGGTPAVGIVWALQTDRFNNGPTVLHAYRSDTLQELYNSEMAPAGRDAPPGTAIKFTVPTVANGKVYVGTSNGLAVYGILPLVAP